MNARLIQGFKVAILGALVACASAPTSKELQDARRVVRDAEHGASARAPDHLLAAQQTLRRAERQERGSPEEVHYAYLADRQARLALAHAGIAAEQERFDQAKAQYLARQSELRERAEERLAGVQAQLKATEQDRGGPLGMRGERNARMQAEDRLQREQRVETARRSLRQVAKVEEDARGITITIPGSVLFRTGEATLLPVGQRDLDRVGDALEEIADQSPIVVEGHTDAVGSLSLNRELSQARADVVREHLIGRGIDAAMIRSIGKGEEEPIADNRTPEGRAKNRRIEIEVLHDQGITPVVSR